jgi:hypothetical protein
MAASASTTIGPEAAAASRRIGLTGWGIFASVTLIALGAVNAINGFTAIQHSSYYRSDIVYDNLTFWGWLFIIWGVLELIAGGLVLARSTLGYYLGVSLALVAAILWFFMIFAAPMPALAGILLSMAVLYALTRGSEEAF